MMDRKSYKGDIHQLSNYTLKMDRSDIDIYEDVFYLNTKLKVNQTNVLNINAIT